MGAPATTATEALESAADSSTPATSPVEEATTPAVETTSVEETAE